MQPSDDGRSLAALLLGDGRPLITLTALALIGSGLFGALQAATGHFLPHDVAYLRMTAVELCDLHECRIVHFMIHDRVSFGGAIIGVGVLYLYLTALPLKQGKAWAWWTLVLSGLVGFASFLTYLGYGYLDTWHGVATLLLLPAFVTGLVMTRWASKGREGWRSLRVPAVRRSWGSRHDAGRTILLLTSASLMLGGLVIMTVGMTSVFVPEDLEYMGVTAAEIRAVNPRLIPLIAHDRAGFGGGVVCTGLTMLLCVWCGEPSRALWQALLITGIVGFGTAIGVHYPVGYTTFTHLAPAYVGATLFVIGIVLSRPRGQASVLSPES